MSASGPSGPLVLFVFVFSLMRVGTIKIPLLPGHHRPASETPFKWRFAGVPMMALHLNGVSLAGR